MNYIRRKVFISYFHADQEEVEEFIDEWEDVFIPKAIGVSDIEDFIDSNDPAYVMTQIRRRFLQDSTVTIVLLGSCTHSRRYVDWEIKTSLRQGNYTPNGLLGIILPSQGNSCHLPERFADNWTKGHKACYARLYSSPKRAAELGGWIEDAYDARTSRSDLIVNPAGMMKYSRKCAVCGVTH